jgi:hypothetical protein
MRPPMCPPTETLGMANVKTRLRTISIPIPVENGSIPRERMATKAAPMRPKTAPEAPTVGSLGSRTRTRNDPPISDRK